MRECARKRQSLVIHHQVEGGVKLLGKQSLDVVGDFGANPFLEAIQLTGDFVGNRRVVGAGGSCGAGGRSISGNSSIDEMSSAGRLSAILMANSLFAYRVSSHTAAPSLLCSASRNAHLHPRAAKSSGLIAIRLCTIAHLASSVRCG